MFSCFWFHNGKKNNGVIINISSDLAVRAPDQRVYSSTDSFHDIKSFKPLGYSEVVKPALIGMTRYLAEYWGHKNIKSKCCASWWCF